MEEVENKQPEADPKEDPKEENQGGDVKEESAPEKEAPKEVLNWIRATKGEEIHLVSCDEVCYFKAEDKYISLFTRQGTQFSEYLIRTSLKDLLSQLDDELFWQIHRSTIVNVRMIEKVKKDLLEKCM